MKCDLGSKFYSFCSTQQGPAEFQSVWDTLVLQALLCFTFSHLFLLQLLIKHNICVSEMSNKHCATLWILLF